MLVMLVPLMLLILFTMTSTMDNMLRMATLGWGWSDGLSPLPHWHEGQHTMGLQLGTRDCCSNPLSTCRAQKRPKAYLGWSPHCFHDGKMRSKDFRNRFRCLHKACLQPLLSVRQGSKLETLNFHNFGVSSTEVPKPERKNSKLRLSSPLQGFHKYHPPWSNSITSITNEAKSFRKWGLQFFFGFLFAKPSCLTSLQNKTICLVVLVNAGCSWWVDDG